MSKPWGLGKKLLTGWMLQTLAIISLFSVAMHESTEWMEKSRDCKEVCVNPIFANL